MDTSPNTITGKITSSTLSTLGDSRVESQRSGPTDSADTRRNRRRQSGRSHNRTVQARFKSSVEGLEDAVYDSGLPNSSQDLFTTTTERLGEYVAKTYDHAGEFRTGLMNLAFPSLKKPPDPGKDPTFAQQQEYKSDYENWNKAKQRRSHNMQRVFALILGQCSDTIKNRIRSDQQWLEIDQKCDVISLLILIRDGLYQNAANLDKTHAMIEADERLNKFRQGEKMSVYEYREKMKSLIDIYAAMGGEPGTTEARIKDYMMSIPTHNRQIAKEAARDHYLGMMLIIKADRKRYGGLIANLKNQHNQNIQGYPTNSQQAYQMLVDYVPINKIPSQHDHHGEGISYLQHDEDKSAGSVSRNTSQTGRTGGRGHGRAGRGGRTGGRSEGEVSHLSEVVPNDSETSEPYLVYVMHDMRNGELFISNKGASSLPDTWLLIENCSTVDIISSPKLLHGIHRVSNPIRVRCNAGVTMLNQMGYLGDYPRPVWFNPDGGANIMSMFNITQQYHLSMDTHEANAILMHHNNGDVTVFTPSEHGLYKHALHNNESIAGFWSCIQTVADRKEHYTQREIQDANRARRFQNIIMRPSDRELMDVSIEYLPNCPVTRRDIHIAKDIYGANLGSLKGKTVRRTLPHVPSGADPIPYELLKRHPGVTIVVDIFFINNISFLLSLSRGLRFLTVEVLPNRQVGTVKDRIRSICLLYQRRGFEVESLHADSEFEPIRSDFPFLNTSDADDHQPDIERAIRSVKDRVRSSYRMLPYKYIPRLMVVHLVRNTIFWLNAFPVDKGWSSKHSPRYIMTGKHLDYHKHVRAEFGEYVQTHEEHDSDMRERTVGAICLGPNGNQQGGHYFMSLATGVRLIRSRWTPLPMPREAQSRVENFGRKQNMPKTLTFGDRHGHEITDSLVDVDEWSDDDDGTYEFQEGHDTDDFSYDDEDEPMDDTTSNNIPTQPSISSVSQSGELTGVDAHNAIPGTDETHNESDEATGVVDDLATPSDSFVNTGVEQTVGADDTIEMDNEERLDDSNLDTTEEAEYEMAEQMGIEAAHNDEATLPKRVRKQKADEIYEYYNAMFTGIDVDHIFTEHDGDHTNQVLNFLTDQMSAKAGLKEFGDKGAASIMQELEQLLYRKVIVGRKASSLTSQQRKAALQYLMFLKEKRCGKVKARGCADGRKQRLYKTKEETSSPTMNVEALFITCIIDALEGCEVMTCDIPGAFMQSETDELVHMKLEGEIALLLVRLDPSYKQFLSYHRGKPVIYTELNKALYGTLQAALLFWRNLSGFLIEKLGFEANPYDFCVVNKIIDGSQCTIAWHVDDLKISHVDGKVNQYILDTLQKEYGKEAPIPSTTGKIHEYLGMTIDYSTPGKVVFRMEDYIDRLIKECPQDLLKGNPTSPAANHLFEINPDCEKLNSGQADDFHHLVAKLLYLAKRTRPDILLAVAFLCTRVTAPDSDDYKKLGRCISYLRGTKGLCLTLEAKDMSVIHWWIDASFAVHADYKSHTGACLSFGRGCPVNISSKQKINTRSSTEAELVGINDAMALVLWCRLFIMGQGYEVRDNVVYQDNQSTMLLGTNGRHSSGKKTRHIEIRYYFITDHIQRKNIRLAYCPTESMISDFYTKPLQGSQFRKFRAFILNLDHDGPPVEPQECVGTSSATTESRVEPGGSTVCPAPAASSSPRSYADVVANGKATTGPCSLVRR